MKVIIVLNAIKLSAGHVLIMRNEKIKKSVIFRIYGISILDKGQASINMYSINISYFSDETSDEYSNIQNFESSI